MQGKSVEKLNFNLGQLECKLAGWGVTDMDDPTSSHHLMEVTLPWLQRNRFCHMQYVTVCDILIILVTCQHPPGPFL